MRSAALASVVLLVGATVGCVPDPPPVPSGPGVASIVTEGREVTVTAPDGVSVVVELADLAEVPPPPEGQQFPLSPMAIRLGGVAPGATVRIDVTMDSPVTSVRKLINGVWDPFEFDGTTGVRLSADGRTATLDLTDGGRGDSDGLANGTIVDPVAFVDVLPSIDPSELEACRPLTGRDCEEYFNQVLLGPVTMDTGILLSQMQTSVEFAFLKADLGSRLSDLEAAIGKPATTDALQQSVEVVLETAINKAFSYIPNPYLALAFNALKPLLDPTNPGNWGVEKPNPESTAYYTAVASDAGDVLDRYNQVLNVGAKMSVSRLAMYTYLGRYGVLPRLNQNREFVDEAEQWRWHQVVIEMLFPGLGHWVPAYVNPWPEFDRLLKASVGEWFLLTKKYHNDVDTASAIRFGESDRPEDCQGPAPCVVMDVGGNPPAWHEARNVQGSAGRLYAHTDLSASPNPNQRLDRAERSPEAIVDATSYGNVYAAMAPMDVFGPGSSGLTRELWSKEDNITRPMAWHVQGLLDQPVWWDPCGKVWVYFQHDVPGDGVNDFWFVCDGTILQRPLLGNAFADAGYRFSVAGREGQPPPGTRRVTFRIAESWFDPDTTQDQRDAWVTSRPFVVFDAEFDGSASWWESGSWQVHLDEGSDDRPQRLFDDYTGVAGSVLLPSSMSGQVLVYLAGECIDFRQVVDIPSAPQDFVVEFSSVSDTHCL